METGLRTYSLKILSPLMSPYTGLPIYPGTGLNSKENIKNYPLGADCGPEKYIKTLREALDSLNDIKQNYEQVAISAGFDALKGDLASLGLEVSSYRKIGEIIANLDLPRFAVLEGGYTNKLGKQIKEFIEAL